MSRRLELVRIGAHFYPKVLLDIYANPKSLGPSGMSRRQKLWALNKQSGEITMVPTKNLAKQNNAYGGAHNQAAEEFFQVFESRIRQLILKATLTDSANLTFELMNQVACLYIRNIRHETDHDDRFQTFIHAFNEIRFRILAGLEPVPWSETTTPYEDDLLIASTISKWGWKILDCNKPLLLSDHPVRLFAHESKGIQGYCWVWPITPSRVFVAVTNNMFVLGRSQLADVEVDLINEFTARDTNLWLLSQEKLPKEDLDRYRQVWRNSEPLRSFQTATRWHQMCYQLPDFLAQFTFLTERRCQEGIAGF